MLVARLVLVTAVILAANAVALSTIGTAAATRVSGEAYSLAVGAPSQPVNGAPYVALPPSGGAAADTSPGTGTGFGSGVSNVDLLTVTTAGALAPDGGTATSTASIKYVELFAGLVRASDVQVVATSTQDGGRAFSRATVTFGNLTVAGLDYTNAPVNERVELPGVGYVVINEQIVGGDGQNTTSIIARAFRLQVTAPTALDVPNGTEFVVANASTGVPDISASTVVAAARPTPTLVAAYNPISTREPVNISLRDEGDNLSGNFNENFDTNDNGGTTAGGAGGGAAAKPGGSPGAASASVAVTVVVVVAPATSTPTPTSTTRPAPKP